MFSDAWLVSLLQLCGGQIICGCMFLMIISYDSSCIFGPMVEHVQDVMPLWCCGLRVTVNLALLGFNYPDQSHLRMCWLKACVTEAHHITCFFHLCLCIPQAGLQPFDVPKRFCPRLYLMCLWVYRCLEPFDLSAEQVKVGVVSKFGICTGHFCFVYKCSSSYMIILKLNLGRTSSL